MLTKKFLKIKIVVIMSHEEIPKMIAPEVMKIIKFFFLFNSEIQTKNIYILISLLRFDKKCNKITL